MGWESLDQRITTTTLKRFRKFLKMNEFTRLNTKNCLLSEGVDPPTHEIERVLVNVNGREEHEAVIKDAEKCKELGLDQIYESMVYLNRWGGWLNENP